LRLVPAHAAPGSVGAGEEGLGIALATDDVGARAHAARDDSELSFPRADGTLARNIDAFPVVFLLLHIVVMAVDRLASDFERRKLATKHIKDQLQHFASVRERVVLRPAYRFDVVVEGPRALGEPGEVAVGEVDLGLHHRLARRRDEILPDAVADATAARMQ